MRSTIMRNGIQRGAVMVTATRKRDTATIVSIINMAGKTKSV